MLIYEDCELQKINDKKIGNGADVNVWVNVCDPRDCACCASSRRFEPW